ncbi:MAG: stage III sporulation protein AB [Firmicutes bacterium]|nr:stage III sporulation protein AB [Bacillota bacterium]
MWRLFGAALVLAACGMFGALVARARTERIRVLGELETAFSMLATEIGYAATPLPEALLKVSRHSPPPVDGFLERAAGEIAGPSGVPTAEAWAAAVRAQRSRWCLAREDEAVLLDLGPYLGQTGAADQEKHLRLTLTRLGRLHARAEAEAHVQSRLWRYLGLCAGGLMVLLFY